MRERKREDADASASAPPAVSPRGGAVAHSLHSAFGSFDVRGAGVIATTNLRAALSRAGVGVGGRKAAALFADLGARNVGAIDLPLFERIARAIGTGGDAEPAPRGRAATLCTSAAAATRERAPATYPPSREASADALAPVGATWTRDGRCPARADHADPLAPRGRATWAPADPLATSSVDEAIRAYLLEAGASDHGAPTRQPAANPTEVIVGSGADARRQRAALAR